MLINLEEVKMKKTLVIMAAGIGSRFGGGVKQLAKVGANGEIIMDYSINAALRAGFNKIVFIIRRDIEADFKEIIGERIERLCEVEYVYQSVDDVPERFKGRFDRKKPWGTGQAVLACKDAVKEPFAVINADDYYGDTAFQKIHDFIYADGRADNEYCMAGFILKNTLSDNGGVTRGLCEINDKFSLVNVNETQNIVKTERGAGVMGEDGAIKEIDPDLYVSMNMWGLTPAFFDILESGFDKFLENLPAEDLKSEYLLPNIIDELIKSGKASVTLLETADKWFGITYKEDLQSVVDALSEITLK